MRKVVRVTTFEEDRSRSMASGEDIADSNDQHQQQQQQQQQPVGMEACSSVSNLIIPSEAKRPRLV